MLITFPEAVSALIAFRFKRFQSRIGVFFVGLLLVVQAIVFVAVDRINTRHAHAQIEQALALGAENFRSLMAQRTAQLIGAVRILSSDFAFKSALFSGDSATVQSVLTNQRDRVGADVVILVSMDHGVAMDTRRASGVYPPGLSQLVREAEAREQAAGLVVLDGKAYQLTVLPVLAPEPIAWLVAGFALDDRLAASLHRILNLDVSFYEKRANGIRTLASSLPPQDRRRQSQSIAPDHALDRVAPMQLGDEDFLDFAARIDTQSETPIFVLLQRSVTQELRGFQEARKIVVLLSLSGLLLSLFGAYFIARSVTRPVRFLLHAVQRVERGEYSHAVEVRQQDEIGELASAFNRMVRGLAERDRVRDLFGKFVSRDVAEKLLSGEVVLGGEDRVVTVLFSDLRNFTALSERRTPREVVALLNSYLARMSNVIEKNQGVVDKYLGDGIMAIFGAPTACEDDAGNAIQAATEMIAELAGLNLELAAAGLPELNIGIGINTGVVMAGSMGSPNRLNYTVIGDDVNLAARIEGLTKRAEFGARIIVTEATVKASKRAFATRSLGRVPVRGKHEPVALYAVDILPAAGGAAAHDSAPAGHDNPRAEASQ